MANLDSKLDDRGVLYLALNRPELHNAFDSNLVSTLTEALERAGDNPQVRIIVLTGTGPSFSAGADLDWMRSMVNASEQENEQDALQLARLMRTLNYHDRPTIACVNGPAFGGGVGLIACCDIAIASDDAKFGLTEATLGLAPAVISPYVARCIGERQARRYFLTGERFDAEHARTIGLVHEVVAGGTLDDQLESMLARMLKAGPVAQRECKRLAFTVSGHDRDRQRELDQHTARLIATLRISEEGQEGLNAFLEKRSPAWTTEA